MAETGKDRSRRIDTNYHRKVDAAVKLKRQLGVLAAIVGIGYASYILFASIAQQRSGPISTGDLSTAHAAWNSEDCENCHTPNIPIRTDALWGNDPQHIQLNNQKCKNCHPVGGHFTAYTQAAILRSESCSTCHREHVGLEHDLARVDDSHCVRCHIDLTKFAISGRSGQRANVTSFSPAGGHPEFRSLRADPGTIAFSHIQHLRPGQTSVPGDKTAMTLKRIPEKYQPKYADRDDPNTGIVQLICNDCHVPDSAWPDPLGGIAPMATAESDHRFYQPIKFDAHCAACHQLPLKLPHGLNRQGTLESIEAHAAREALQDTSKLDVLALAQKTTRLAHRIFEDGEICFKCHRPARAANDEHLVVSGKIPQRWLEGAIFQHGAHKDIDCARCHTAAYAKTEQRVDSRSESQQVMISGLNNCVTCHVSQLEERAKRIEQGEKRLASGACLECHRYHVDPSTPTASVSNASSAAKPSFMSTNIPLPTDARSYSARSGTVVPYAARFRSGDTSP